MLCSYSNSLIILIKLVLYECVVLSYDEAKVKDKIRNSEFRIKKYKNLQFLFLSNCTTRSQNAFILLQQ
jgi:hypothetical protein